MPNIKMQRTSINPKRQGIALWLLDHQGQVFVHHTFTHFHLTLALFSARMPRRGGDALQTQLSDELDTRINLAGLRL